jgi:hypothetical protein
MVRTRSPDFRELSTCLKTWTLEDYLRTTNPSIRREESLAVILICSGNDCAGFIVECRDGIRTPRSCCAWLREHRVCFKSLLN